ncbi:GNAT family N-acetyltransferase [Nitratireductor sp. CAU 1489]|uniref:GNAT family N-acetyltransferase n=1 Tax=Nitratireductor arenosus TaxID=2682096 RepID=A0A844QCA2_9HYPH|nr:GNAT family N-acetyltransferase [Nitratireductor arenosus]
MRSARPDETRRLIAVETAAARLFADHGYPALAEEAPRTLQEFARFTAGNSVLVAESGDAMPAGFVVAGDIGGYFYLMELSVDPAHGRRGLGTALVRAALAAARRSGYRNAALSTFRAVPFNAPFYRKLGFVELEPARAEPALRARFLREVPPGVEASARVLMVRRIGD